MGIIKSLCWCLICRERGNLKYVRQRGCYGSAGFWYGYHQKCLDSTCELPEEYSHRQVDAALEIISFIDHWKKEEAAVRDNFRDACESLRSKGDNVVT